MTLPESSETKGNNNEALEQPQIVPNSFSLSELINNENDMENDNNDNTIFNKLTNTKQTKEINKPPLQSKKSDNNIKSPTLRIIDSNYENSNLPPSANNENILVSPSSKSKKYKMRTPTTPVIKNFFGGNNNEKEKDELNSPIDNDEKEKENEYNWLKRIPKFNHSEPNFGDWKQSFFPFNRDSKKAPSLSKTPKKVKNQSRKLKLSESDKLARARATYLIDSLSLGYTASNLVSSVFLLDEQETRRAPLLAHLVGIRIYDITENYYSKKRRHVHHNQNFQNNNNAESQNPQTPTETNNGPESPIANNSLKVPPVKRRKFRFDMEYGVGNNRAKWTLIKSYKELLNFSLRLRILSNATLNLKKKSAVNKLNLPVFPKLKNINHHALVEFSSDSESSISDTERAPGILNSVGNSNNNNNNATSNNNDDGFEIVDLEGSLVVNSRDSRSSDEDGEDVNPLTVVSTRSSLNSQFHNLINRVSNSYNKKKSHQEKNYGSIEDYNNKLEHYFKHLFLELSLRPQSNKLFQFFELSPIGVLLSNENGYRGKQGYLLIATSAKKQGWRVGHLKARDIGAMIKRHTNKWFCVRESYIIYVADINSTTILDVFLVDEMFKLKYSGDDQDANKNSNNNNNRISELFSEDESEDDEQILDEEATNEKQLVKKKSSSGATPHLNISVENRERKLKMVAKSAHEMKLWVRSIQIMLSRTEWSLPKRFDSFAPVRQNCFAQWFVDARDYWWAASSAIEMAKDVIFIHDWWLSPELYLRRPANGNQEWRIDRLLKRKAEQGVKIFIIIYRNIGEFVVIDSSWTKHSLMDLHENIRVLRSPNQFLQNTFFWAHHEKLLIIDHTIAFLGGIDLCYGRYDTPDHVLADDAPLAFPDDSAPNSSNNTNSGSANSYNIINNYQIFPGKDYSNPRVKDFFELDKPFDSMYDRQKVPRMPWHDVHMVNAGQIARDLSRHFVQRWNYLIRQKRPSRPTPLLTPPTNITDEEVEELGFKGSCEVQLLRSSGYWSLGLNKTEHSIQNAYLKLIETSEHFVYIENQFFVTACAWDNVVIKNRIGDALVDRIIRADKEGTSWKAVIVIPLMPGFEAQVDEPEGSSVRVIMQCQYMSISRGSTSIFAKLKKAKIDPEKYIQFFSLRKWGRIGEYGKLVSEQLYIHAKTMVVDDRVAIIGSANINERSMRGSRDSEVCAVIRDTEMVKTTMNGKPYLAGKFAHTLRMRLMREHLGIDVDQLELVERKFDEIEKMVKIGFESYNEKITDAVTGKFNEKEHSMRSAMVEIATREILDMPKGSSKWEKYQFSKKKIADLERLNNFKINEERSHNAATGTDNVLNDMEDEDEDGEALSPISNDDPLYRSFNHRAWVENAGLREKKQFSSDPRIKNNEEHKADVAGQGSDNMNSRSYGKWKLNARQTIKKWALHSSNSKRFKSVFIPNLDSLKEFLDNDDEFLEIEKTSEDEEILGERDQERWELLKRVAYIQRLAVKYEKELKEENSKRVKMGLEPKTSPFASPDTIPVSDQLINRTYTTADTVNGTSKNNLSNTTTTENDPIPIGIGDTENAKDISKSDSINSNVNNTGTATITPPITDSANREIPITSLNDDEIDQLFETHKIEKSRFIDPYSFSDPLDDEFYEGMWAENAQRNTAIFRLVFHCQPDDAVTTWSEYKEKHRLMTAFSIAQDYEIEAIKEQGLKFDDIGNFEYSSEDEDLDNQVEDYKSNSGAKRPSLHTHKTSRSIRIDDLDKDAIGALGMPPEEHMRLLLQQKDQEIQSSHNSQPPRLQKINKSLKKFSNRRKGAVENSCIPEDEENAYDGEDEDDDNEEREISSVRTDNEEYILSGKKTNDEVKNESKQTDTPTTYTGTSRESTSITPEKMKDSEDKISFLNTPIVNGKSVSKSSSFHDQSTYTPGYKSSTGNFLATPSPMKNRNGLLGRKRTGTFGNRRHKFSYNKDLIFDKETADKILSEINGHVVVFPVDWLWKELESNNWFTNSDRLPPIEIYD